MNKLTQIKGNDGVLYDVSWDEDFETFVIWEHYKNKIQKIYISSLEMKYFIKTNQVEIINDGNNIISKNIMY